MRLRIQFSLRTLLLLTLLVGGGLAFVVMPWQHRQKQLAILERLRNDYGLGVEQKEGEEFYTLENYDVNYENFNNELIHLINSCELIGDVKLQFQGVVNETYTSFKRLLKLRKISELEIGDISFDEEKMQTLRQLPLKVLKIQTFNSQFQTWPINSQLEEFRYTGHAEALAPLRLIEHRKLRELDLQCYQAKECMSVEIRNCPALDVCHIRLEVLGNSEQLKPSLVLQQLRNLEALSLCYSHFEPASIEIHDLPKITNFDLEGVRWKRIEESKQWQLKSVYYTHGQEMDAQEWAALLSYSNLETLGLSVSHPESKRFDIPRFSKLRSFNFGYRDQVLRTPDRKRIPAALAVKYLEQMPKIQQIYLVLDRVTPELQQQICSYPDLYSLSLLVQDELPALDFLRHLASLSSLTLSCAKFTLEQTKLLGTLTQLNEIMLNSAGNQITDFSSLQQHRGWKVLFNGQDIRKAGSTIPATPDVDFSDSE